MFRGNEKTITVLSEKTRALWHAAWVILDKAGVCVIDQSVKQICLLWTSTRKKVKPEMLAVKYLMELQATIQEQINPNESHPDGGW